MFARSTLRPAGAALLFAAAAFFAPVGVSAQAQPAQTPAPDNSLKTCGDKWRAARASGGAEGQTWMQFLSRCRSELAAGPSPAPGRPADAPRRRSRTPAERPAPAGEPVFPSAVASKFASEKPTRARQKTCSEQFQANKATGGNAGLRWVQRGGGYWSACNKRLRETRA